MLWSRMRLVSVCFMLMATGSDGLAAAAPSTLDAVKKAGKLVVAIDATYPPMETEDASGKPAGFDVDLARELARRLGVKAEFVVMSWDGIIAGLLSKRYDTIVSTMNITPERQQQLEFVEYLQISQVFVGRPGMTMAKEQDLAGKTVAVQADTTSSDYVEKAKARGIAITGIKAFKQATDVFAALRAGQADAVVIDEPVGRYYVKQDDKHFVITGQAMAPEPVGIAVRKDAADLGREFARLLVQLHHDGTFKKMQEIWFGGELSAK